MNLAQNCDDQAEIFSDAKGSARLYSLLCEMPMRTTEKLRQRIDTDLNQGRWSIARQQLAGLWNQDPKITTANYILKCFELLNDHVPLAPCRLALLRSFTIEPLVTLLQAGALVGGIHLNVHVGSFNTYAQEILDQGSSLYKFEPDVAILAVQTRDVAPDLWERYTDLSSDEVRSAVERVSESFRTYVRAFRANSDAYFILHNLDEPHNPSLGILDRHIDTGQIAAIRQINLELYRISKDFSGVYLLDYDSCIAQHGRRYWYDEHKWTTMRMPLASDNLIHLVKEWLRFLHPLSGKVCKALITDLDNTI